MNYIKINQEAIKQMIKGNKWGHTIPGYWEGEFLVITLDGYCAFVLPKDNVRFDTSAVKSGSDKGFLPELSTFVVPGNEIKMTKTLVESGFRSKKLLRRFKGIAGQVKWKTYVDEAMLKPLKDERCVSFYQIYKDGAEMERQPILATAANGTPLMIFMPIRIVDESEFD